VPAGRGERKEEEEEEEEEGVGGWVGGGYSRCEYEISQACWQISASKRHWRVPGPQQKWRINYLDGLRGAPRLLVYIN